MFLHADKVRLLAIRFLIKQQAGKIAPSLYCHLRKVSHHFKVNGKSLWGIWATGVESMQCHTSCYKRLQPETTDIKKSLQVAANSLITRARSRGPVVSVYWPFLKDYTCPHIWFSEMWQCCEPSGCQWHGNIICTLHSVCEPHLVNEYLVGMLHVCICCIKMEMCSNVSFFASLWLHSSDR